jgi:preprotein translocase subunit SecG
MTTFLTIIHVLLCLLLIGVVLLQSGRSGGMGVLSGAASQQVFGGRGAGNFLQRVTAVVSFLFLLTCTALGYLASSTRDRGLTTPEPTSTTVTVGTAGQDGANSSSSSERAVASDGDNPASTADESDASAVPTAEESADASVNEQ